MNATDLEAPDAHRLHAAQQVAARGLPVVGLVGAVVPPELVLAAGCYPLHLMARAEDWAVDASPMESGHEPEIRSLFSQLLQGALDFAVGIVVPSTSDGYRYLYGYLKEVQRRGMAPRMPGILPLDLLFGGAAAAQLHGLDSLRELGSRLAGLSGQVPGDEPLRVAMVQTNAVRQQLRRLHQLRRTGRVTGTQAHAATRATGFWDAASSAQALARGIDGWTQQAPLEGRPRWLLASAVPLYHEHLHGLLEAAGGLVTAEDDEWGARRAQADAVPADGDPMLSPLTALFEHSMRYAVSPRMLQDEREAWLCSQMQSNLHDGVVFYVPPSDQHFGWRYPALRDLAAACGLPSLLVRDDALDPQAAPAIHDQASAFASAWRAARRP